MYKIFSGKYYPDKSNFIHHKPHLNMGIIHLLIDQYTFQQYFQSPYTYMRKRLNEFWKDQALYYDFHQIITLTLISDVAFPRSSTWGRAANQTIPKQSRLQLSRADKNKKRDSLKSEKNLWVRKTDVRYVKEWVSSWPQNYPGQNIWPMGCMMLKFTKSYF